MLITFIVAQVFCSKIGLSFRIFPIENLQLAIIDQLWMSILIADPCLLFPFMISESNVYERYYTFIRTFLKLCGHCSLLVVNRFF